MDKAYLKDLLNSLRAELVRFRYLCVVLFIAVSFLLLFLGITWPKKFTTSAVLFADQTTIIEPLLKGSAEMTKIDRSEQAREIIWTRGIMLAVAREVGMVDKNASQEDEEQAIRWLVASGSLPPGVPADFYARLARLQFQDNLAAA